MRGPRPRLVALSLAVVLVTARGTPVGAACNTIPQPPPMFRGLRGSVDRPFLRPGQDDLTIRFGTSSGSPRLRDANGDGTIDARDFLVTLVFKAVEGARAVVLVGDGACRRPRCPSLARLFHRARPSCFSGAEVGLAGAATATEGTLGFRFPDTGFAGPLAVAVTAAGQPAPRELRTRSCAQMDRGDLFACIDDLGPAPPGKGTTAAAAVPPAPCPTQLLALAQPGNEFRALCSRKKDDDTEPQCNGDADAVTFTTDAEGTVVLPVSWKSILRPKGPGLDRRCMRGSTAVAAFEGGTGRIDIPSAAFLASVGPGGTAFDERPLFIPEDLPDRRNELTLSGTADKGESILCIARRRLWDHTCDGGQHDGQACEPQPVDHADIDDCPGGRCVGDPPARYFFCRGGAGGGLPCTRPHHCTGGSCMPGSTCRAPAGPPTETACSTDGDCPAGQECGQGLFDFRSRLRDGTGHIARAAGGGEHGVCGPGDREGQPCTSAWQCWKPPFGFVPCLGYRADALRYVPGP